MTKLHFDPEGKMRKSEQKRRNQRHNKFRAFPSRKRGRKGFKE